MKRAALHTLGCKLNYAETAALSEQFVRGGYELASIDEPVDLAVINTCSVTRRADQECRQIIRRVRRTSPGAVVAVVGCYAQLRPEELASLSEVDMVLGTREKFHIVSLLEELGSKQRPVVHVSPAEDLVHTDAASSAEWGERTRVFLKIQDGCDYHCSYCTIPLARGRSRSVPEEDIVREARKAAEQGYKEIVLTGVNVGDYRSGDREAMLRLLNILAGVHGIDRIRISSIEPNLLTDELLDLWLSEKILCKHWHVPLQSGSDTILGLMRRRYRRDAYAEKIFRIKERCPGAGIGADVIAGFPGETDVLFEETYRFIEDLPLTYLHVFPFSERPNTDAVRMPGKVQQSVKFERSERLRKLGMIKKAAFHASFLNKSVPVLFETRKNGDILSGLTEEYVRVDVASKEAKEHTIGLVTIIGAHADACKGVVTAK